MSFDSMQKANKKLVFSQEAYRLTKLRSVDLIDRSQTQTRLTKLELLNKILTNIVESTRDHYAKKIAARESTRAHEKGRIN